jgi:hypothetical protein
MIIDNTKIVIRDRMMMYVMAISLTVAIPLICLSDYFNDPVLGISRELYVIIICAVYVIYNLYRFFLNLNFIYFNDQSEKIIFKYYSLRPFMQKRRSIEIVKGSFAKFEVNKDLTGRKKNLVLYQKINNKIAKYPSISISALNNEEYRNLLSALNASISNSK